MSTISGVGGANSAWADLLHSRAAAMKDRMFAKADSDGNGVVDKAELQGKLDNVAQKTGNTAGSADALLAKMDSDGNGSLNKDELAAGIKSLVSPASSTMDFAHQRLGDKAVDAVFSSLAGDGNGKAVANLSVAGFLAAATAGRPGASAPDASSPGQINQTDLSKAIASSMDANGDHQISQSEADDFRSQLDGALYSAATSHNAGIAPGGPTERSKALASAMDANGDHQISQNEADDFRNQVDGALYAAATSYNAGGVASQPADRSKAITSAMDANGDHQISQNEADDFRSQIDHTLFTAATSYNAAGLASELTDRSKGIALAMDANGDHQISQSEADDFRSQIDGAMYAAATSYNAGGSAGRSNGPVSPLAPQVRPDPSAQGSIVANEYSLAATNFAPSQTLSVAA